MWEQLLGAGVGLLGGLFGNKEDKEVAKNRLAARNIAMFGGRPTPQETTSALQGTTSTFDQERQREIDAQKEQLRRSGQLNPGMVARSVQDINRDISSKTGNAINQYKYQAAINAGNRSLEAARLVASLPGFTPDPKSAGIGQAFAGLGGAISGIGAQKHLDTQTNQLIDAMSKQNMMSMNPLSLIRRGFPQSDMFSSGEYYPTTMIGGYNG